ncbi:MAG TPA: zf-HC2 domain-containing protein [Solirubrobacteraceae bacterium]|nr:zf-HC2 domain-containing protein [Solirubrobacteraceae bacterium]
MLSCRELVALVTDYVEEALPDTDRRRLDAHLARCRDCTAYLAGMRLTLLELGTIGDPEHALDDAPPELLERFRAWAADR